LIVSQSLKLFLFHGKVKAISRLLQFVLSHLTNIQIFALERALQPLHYHEMTFFQKIVENDCIFKICFK